MRIAFYVAAVAAVSIGFVCQGVSQQESVPPDHASDSELTSSFGFAEVEINAPLVDQPGGWFAKLGEVWIAGPYGAAGAGDQSELKVFELSHEAAQDGVSEFVEIGRFEAPAGIKSAAVVSEGNYLWLIGGRDAEACYSSVYCLAWDGKGLDIQRGPDLPEAVAYGGAAILDGHLYYAGGLTGLSEGVASDGFWRLALDSDPNAGAWEVLDPMPAGGRVLPVVFSLFGQINVVGGFELPPSGGGGTLSPTASNWVYREIPVDGTLKTGWLQRSEVPEPLAASAVYITGQSHAALIGGYTSGVEIVDLVAGSLPEGSSGSSIWLTHLITDTWLLSGDTPVSLPPGRISHAGEAVYWFSPSSPGAFLEVTLNRELRQLVTTDYIVIVIYFILMAAIGLWFARQQTDSDEFALGGRRVKWWASGISMFATGASSISFMAIPAIAFGSNLVWLAPIVIFMVPAFYLQGYVIYPLLRKLNLTSTFTYLEQRYGLPLRMLASVQAIAFQLLGRMSVVMLLPSMAISAVTGLDVVTSVILMGLLTTIYTTFGGFEAVIWTDVLQGGMMVLGCVVMCLVAVFSLSDGVSGFVNTSIEYEKFMYAIWELDWVYPVFWFSVLTFFFQQIGFAADQPVVQRVYATPVKDMKKLALMAAFCGLLIALLANFTGLSLFAFFHENPQTLDPTMDMDQVVPLFIVQKLPVGIAGLIVAAIFAASMSTLSSSMNSVATLIGEDFYRRFNPNATDKGRLRLMKVASLCTGVIGTGSAWYMAELEITSMFAAWNIVVALLGGGFLGIYILGMFTTRTNTTGVVFGALVSIVLTLWIKQTEAHWSTYTPLAVFACIFFGYLGSLILPGKSKDLAGLTVFTTKEEPKSAT
ncbi:MAG: sodium/solute symporter [Planctomycetota bacterium]